MDNGVALQLNMRVRMKTVKMTITMTDSLDDRPGRKRSSKIPLSRLVLEVYLNAQKIRLNIKYFYQ